MKRNITKQFRQLPLLLAISCLMACNQTPTTGTEGAAERETAQEDVPVQVKGDTLLYTVVSMDSTWVPNDNHFADYGNCEMEGMVQVPSAEQNPMLARAIMEWVTDMVGSSYEGDVMDAYAMMQHCAMVDAKEDLSRRFSAIKIYETEKLVTYFIEGYAMFTGAAHGMPIQYGATFRKDDGKIFGKNIWKKATAEDPLQPILNQGLKAYFSAVSDEQLEENLQLDGFYSATYLPMPASAPWLTEDGVVLLYQPYEIASYAAGSPNVIVPYSEASKMMTATARRLTE